MSSPEELAREKIDALLQQCGWILQDRNTGFPSARLWLKDESLEDSANLPDPDIIAAEIVEDLEAALQQFAAIAGDLKP